MTKVEKDTVFRLLDRFSQLVDCADPSCECEGNEADKDLFSEISALITKEESQS